MRFKCLADIEAERDRVFEQYQHALRKLQEDPTVMTEVSNYFTKFKQLELDVKNFAVYQKIGQFYA